MDFLPMLGVTRSATVRSMSTTGVHTMAVMADHYPRDEELGAWREFLRAHARLTRRMETDLVREQRLSLAAYDVLVQLADAPDRRLRMTDLADALLLSRSGVTRLVGRLEQIGLVSRCRAVGDGRGVVAELTDRGLDRLRTASATHLGGINRHFAGRLKPVQLAMLREICATLAGPSVSPSRPAETHRPVPTRVPSQTSVHHAAAHHAAGRTDANQPVVTQPVRTAPLP